MPAVGLDSLPTIRRRPFRRARRTGRDRFAKVWLLFGFCAAGLGWGLWGSPWPAGKTMLHWLAALITA